MLQRLKICLLALALGLFCAQALAKDLVLEREVFEDVTGEMNLAQVQGAVFVAAPEVVFRGFSRSALWIRLKVDVPDGQGPLAVRIRPTLLDTATLYYPAALATGAEIALSMNTRAAQKETRLMLQAGPQTLYLRAESIGALLVKAQVITTDEGIAQDLAEQRELGAVLSIFAVALAALMGLALIRRSKLVWFISFHLGICLLLYLLVFNLMAEVLPWAWAHGKTASRLIAIVNFLSFFLLMQAFLGHFAMPRLQRLAHIAAACMLLLVFLFFVADRHLVLKVSAVVGPLFTLALLTTLVYFQYKFSSNQRSSLAVRVITVLVVSAFVVIVLRAMLQLLGVVEGGAFLLQSPAWRGIFIPLCLTGFLWQRDREQIKTLVQSQIDQAVSRAQAQDQAERLATQTQFMAMLMHELKTPLYIIQLAATSLSRRVGAPHPDFIRLNSINRSVDDLNFIIERCVQADQLEQSDVPVKKLPVSLKALLRELAPIQGHKRLVFTGLSQAGISTDYQYARLILLNLATNALKYSPPGSAVHVDVQAGAQEDVHGLCFKVSNTVGSAGRPDPDKVFNRYYRAEGAKKEAGAGLGLWLAQSIAIKLGSQLRCTSDEDMVHFYFSLEAS